MALTAQSVFIIKFKLDYQYYQNELSADLRMSRLWFCKGTKLKKKIKSVNIAINIK